MSLLSESKVSNEDTEQHQIQWKGVLSILGHQNFKTFQLDAVKAIQQRKDLIVVQPTLSLINNQVLELSKLGIDVAPLGSTLKVESKKVYQRISNSDGQISRLVYLTQEIFYKIKQKLVQTIFVRCLTIQRIFSRKQVF